MKTPDSSTAKDLLIRSGMAAMLRAADFARGEAIRTETDLVVVRDGRIVLIPAKTLREEAAGTAAATR